jgi:predicted nucleic acid-binding protein
MKKTKIYLDTTIINFIYADDAPTLKEATLNFFDDFVKTKLVDVYISNVMLEEINNTQNIDKRQKLLAKISEYQFEVLSDNAESRRLAKIYIEEKIIPAKKVADAEHIGISTVSEMDILLSWNFQHLANYNRKMKVRAINQRENYFYPLDIISPLEFNNERNYKF